MEIAPGAVHLRGYLPLERQRRLVDECRALIDGDVPGYVPVVRGGGRMRVRMLCLGRHWNGRSYRYEPTRSDFDGLPVPPLPPSFVVLAREIATAAHMTLEPDLCIMNFYDANGMPTRIPVKGVGSVSTFLIRKELCRASPYDKRRGCRGVGGR